MTLSEQRFLEYCRIRNYAVKEIPRQPNVRKTADFRVFVGSTCVIVEIKELIASKDDLARHSGGEDGARARGQVQSAAKQLRSYRSEGVPMVIVLFDNIRVDGRRHDFANRDLTGRQIDAALYGCRSMHLAIDSQNRRLKAPDAAAASRTFTKNEKQYVSAVCVLYDIPELRIYTYHNYYARAALPLQVFSGLGDRHWGKEIDPAFGSGEWQDPKSPSEQREATVNPRPGAQVDCPGNG